MQSSSSVPTPTDFTGPRTLRELYWAFTVLALQGFGGVLAVVQRELVEKKRWLTTAAFGCLIWALVQHGQNT